MSDSYSNPQENTKDFQGDRGRAGFRGGRGANNREGGGFRIRLSDNEMRSARAIQDAFNLRSVVAVLGFAVRTLGLMLEEGKLDELIAEYRSQNPRENNRQNYEGQGGRKKRHSNDDYSNTRDNPKPNPFARPEKPEISGTEEQITQTNKEIEEMPDNNQMDSIGSDISSEEELKNDESITAVSESTVGDSKELTEN